MLPGHFNWLLDLSILLLIMDRALLTLGFEKRLLFAKVHLFCMQIREFIVCCLFFTEVWLFACLE